MINYILIIVKFNGLNYCKKKLLKFNFIIDFLNLNNTNSISFLLKIKNKGMTVFNS